MKTTKFAIAAAVAALSVATAGESVAQACIGTPIVSGQRALSGGVGFPEGATSYNVRLDANAMGPLALQASYEHVAVENVDRRANVIGAGLAYQLPTVGLGGGAALSACPTLEGSYAMTRGEGIEQNRLEVPVGFAVGTRVDVGAGMSLVPYVQPQFVFSRTENVAANSTAVTDTGLGARVGTALDFGPFFTGVDYQATRWNDVPGTQSQVNLRLGVKF